MKKYSFNEAANYDLKIKRQIPHYEKILQLTMDSIHKFNPSFLLELGIGTGSLARKLLECSPNIAIDAWDNSREMLQVAREKLSKFSNNVLLKEGNMFNLNYDFNKYDIVLCAFSFHHGVFYEKKRLLIKIRDALKENGSFYLVDFFSGRDLVEDGLFLDYWKKFLKKKGFSKIDIEFFFNEIKLYDRPESIDIIEDMARNCGFKHFENIYQKRQFAVVKFFK